MTKSLIQKFNPKDISITILLKHHHHNHHYSSPKVDPEDVLLIAVLLEHGLEALLETLDRGLAGSEEGEARQLEKICSIICSIFMSFFVFLSLSHSFQAKRRKNTN